MPVHDHPKMHPMRGSSFNHDHSPPSPPTALSPASSSSDTANTQFPLNNIDYESNPAAVAQELSNLQALRRMSMDVNAAGDPDLPAYNHSMAPSGAPRSADDEDDTSRLFWVPARLHPELAPKEFKTFLDNRLDQMKRRSGDGSLSPDGIVRQGSGGGLRRKKSMLSRQIDNSGGKAAEGYSDGAERLERKRSSNSQQFDLKVSDLQNLDAIAKDSKRLLQKLSIDTGQHDQLENGNPALEDFSILPSAPAGHSLRRSTRTTYRRGSLRKGERVPLSKRAARTVDTDPEDSPTSTPVTPGGAPFGGLTRVQTDPTHSSSFPTENFSRPSRVGRGHTLKDNNPVKRETRETLESGVVNSINHGGSFPERMSSRAPLSLKSESVEVSPPVVIPSINVPKIIETPPPKEEEEKEKVIGAGPSLPKQAHIPVRSSSQDIGLSHAVEGKSSPTPSSSQPKMPKRPALVRSSQTVKANPQISSEMVPNSYPPPENGTQADNLAYTPALIDDKKAEEKKPERKTKDRKEKDKDKDKEKDGQEPAPRKSSWGWFTSGADEKEKEKEKGEGKESSKKAKNKAAKAAEKAHDNTRLDVLQTSIDGTRGRESLVLDRESVKLEEERKKESTRKSSGIESKKEKESGLFSSLFGGGKKRGDRDGSGKKGSSLRTLSPDPPHKALRPDIDYNWTRFSILEERAIYRMAHIKLANPRRALYSQVLLSNFMYSYLAKVQQMHPQIHIPQNPAQKQRVQQHMPQAQQNAPAEHEQAQEPEQDMADSQYYQHSEQPHQPEPVTYVDDIPNYYYDDRSNEPDRPHSRASQHSTSDTNGYGNADYQDHGKPSRNHYNSSSEEFRL